MIHVDGKQVQLDGAAGQLVGEAGAVIDCLAEDMAKNTTINYEQSLQIVIEVIYKCCLMANNEEKENRR